MRFFFCLFFLFLSIDLSAQIIKSNNFPNFPIQNVQKKIWNDNKEEYKKDSLTLKIDEYENIMLKNYLKKDSSLSNFEFRKTEKRIFVDDKATAIQLKIGFSNYVGGLWGFNLKTHSGTHTSYEFDASQNWRRNGVVADRLSGENDLNLAFKVRFHYDSTLYFHNFDVHYERQKRGYYGYSLADLEQNQQTDTLFFSWRKVKAQGFSYKRIKKDGWSIRYYLQNLTKQDIEEFQLGSEYFKNWYVNKKNNFNFILDVASMTYQNAVVRTWWNNHFQWKGNHKKFQYEVNGGVVIHNDGIENPVNPYINVNGIYQFDPKWRVQANIGNQIIRRTLDNTRQENLFLNPLSRLRNDDVNYLEFKTSYFVKPNWEIQMQIGQNRHLYKGLFFNMPTDIGKFGIFYDNMIEKHLKLNTFYQQKEHQLTMQMSFFDYKTSRQTKAWHLPNFTLLLGWKFKPEFKKWQINTHIEILSGINVLMPETETTQLLQPIANGKVEGEYLLAKKFYTFFSINNLFFQKYQRYLSYIQVPFHFTIGLKYELRR